MDLVKKALEDNRITRDYFLKFIDEYSLEQLNKIPTGFSNNLIWNMGHCIASQNGLVYRLSNLEGLVSLSFTDTYKNGTVPTGNTSQEEIDAIKEMLVSQINQCERDYTNGVFESYNAYKTSTNYQLNSSEEAIVFNNLHEAIHLGMALNIRKFI